MKKTFITFLVAILIVPIVVGLCACDTGRKGVVKGDTFKVTGLTAWKTDKGGHGDYSGIVRLVQGDKDYSVYFGTSYGFGSSKFEVNLRNQKYTKSFSDLDLPPIEGKDMTGTWEVSFKIQSKSPRSDDFAFSSWIKAGKWKAS